MNDRVTVILPPLPEGAKGQEIRIQYMRTKLTWWLPSWVYRRLPWWFAVRVPRRVDWDTLDVHTVREVRDEAS